MTNTSQALIISENRTITVAKSHKMELYLERRAIKTVEENGILKVMCSRCKSFKDTTDFYKCKKTANGLKSECKRCHCDTVVFSRDKENAKKTTKLSQQRMAGRIKSEGEIKKIQARSELNKLVYNGEIIKPTQCEKCKKETKTEAHHEDYELPHIVVWLCKSCHMGIHRKNN
jgi:hypothetical protein